MTREYQIFGIQGTSLDNFCVSHMNRIQINLNYRELDYKHIIILLRPLVSSNSWLIFFFSVPWTFGVRCGHFWHCLCIDCSNSKPLISSFRESLSPHFTITQLNMTSSLTVKICYSIYQPTSLCVWLFKSCKGSCNSFSSCVLNRIL